jgi:hypothetical protein
MTILKRCAGCAVLPRRCNYVRVYIASKCPCFECLVKTTCNHTCDEWKEIIKKEVLWMKGVSDAK